MASIAANDGLSSPEIDAIAGKPAFTGIDFSESEEKSGASTASTLAHAREKTRFHPIAPNCLLNDEVEAVICGYISKGLTWSDAARLAGTHRSTCWNWKTKGLAYLDDPAARPEDERYARFVERCEEAELASKVLLVDQISRDPDWRAKAWILKARFPKEFTEFTRQELSGPEGSPVALNVTNQPFQVIFSMPKPDATEEWKIVEPIAPPEDQSANISKFDPLGLRGYEKGIK